MLQLLSNNPQHRDITQNAIPQPTIHLEIGIMIRSPHGPQEDVHPAHFLPSLGTEYLELPLREIIDREGESVPSV